eukprot:TRINITY_DN3632_c0_g1_i1.p1 TRINITY_DN3632_c0_g1~~TRINITY_DN3632_c0_g1_i1.p1  ORF type:complete len:770 (-),score=191.80 TRINITY_DN3632_c0_g1_i1:147-2456(-)
MEVLCNCSTFSPIANPRSPVKRKNENLKASSTRKIFARLKNEEKDGCIQYAPFLVSSVTSKDKKLKPRLVMASASSESGDGSNSVDHIQASLLAGDKPGGADMMKLFNDAQQNMLYLNKQRLIAIDELQKVERDKEYLLARVSQLEAEKEAMAGQRELLEEELRAAEAALQMAASRGASLFGELEKGEGTGGRRKKAGPARAQDPPAVWSRVLLRVDALFLQGVIDAGQATALRNLASSRDVAIAEKFIEVQDADDRHIASVLLGLLNPEKRRGLHVVQVCTEMAPVSQAGQLAPWLTGLCRALRRKGHLVEVILPKYMSMDSSVVEDFRQLQGDFFSYFGGDWHRNQLWSGNVFGVPVTFIDPQHPAKFFDREKMYDYVDDFERFTYFSRAALEYLKKMGKKPDVIHLHNWHTAAAAPLFWDIYSHQGMNNTRLLFTCHDFKYQKVQEPSKLSLCGLDPGQLHRPDRLQDNLDPNSINLLKGGIVYSNRVTTISPLYAADMKTKERGRNMDQTLLVHKHKFFGVVSGLDDTTWGPENDRFLPLPFSADDVSGKAVAKRELRQQLDLPILDELTGLDRPLVACVCPQVSETELEMVKAAMGCALQSNAQFVLVGASRTPKVQAVLEDIQLDCEDANAKLVLRYEEGLVHLLVGAADILVCPSIFEPSRMWPLIGLRYGALPVTREALGSSPDNLIDYDDQNHGQLGLAFLFRSTSAKDMSASLQRAINHFVQDPSAWSTAVEEAIARDSSWNGPSSEAYIASYWAIRQC